MIRAVIDTNILVSAMISPAGNEALLVMAINQGLVAPCLSREILEEYSDVLLRPRFGFPQDEIDDMLDLLAAMATSLIRSQLPELRPTRMTTSSSPAR